MLSVDSLLLGFDLIRRAGFQLCRLLSLVQFSQFRLMLFFILIYPLLDALGDEPCLLLGLAGPLGALGDLRRLAAGLG